MRVKITIEPEWSLHAYDGIIEIDDEDFDSIDDICKDWVNERVCWNWEILDD